MTSAVPQPAVPQPRPTTQPPARERGGRRSLAAALLLGAVGATVVLLSTRQTWSEGAAATAGGALDVIAKGSDVTGAPAALAIVGLAALVAVFAVRRAGRYLVSGLLALSGAGIMAAALNGAGDSAALDEQAATTTGDAGATAAGIAHTAWPYVAAGGGLLILCAGVLALWFGARWPAMSGRYERGGAAAAKRRAKAPDPDRPEDLWKALDRGEDPTG
ncbi:TIGR02234 family membrane protein [Streptomyces apocyni]|uniref:TIGR02234 family membrane protein n=1 Tax=Streptomyces apocyni TaxID=2654677 RepID=UPI0012EAFC9D|nr:TIGR02234 family membrane protein [Streptomyces apocyni]